MVKIVKTGGGSNLDFLKIKKNIIKSVLMTGSSQKSDAIEYLKQKYTLQLLVAFRMVYFLLFHLSENEDFLDFLQKKFFNNDDHWSAQSTKECNYATLFPNDHQFRSSFILFSALDSSKFFQKSGGSEPRSSIGI